MITLRILPLLLLASAASFSYAQVGVGFGVSPDDTSSLFEKKDKKVRPTDVYVQFIARYFHADQAELAKYSNRGYGRNELITSILISSDSAKPLRQIIRERDRGIRFSKIAQEYRLDYDRILDRSQLARKDIDRMVAASTTVHIDINVSSGTVWLSTSPVPGTIVHSSTSTEK